MDRCSHRMFCQDKDRVGIMNNYLHFQNRWHKIYHRHDKILLFNHNMCLLDILFFHNRLNFHHQLNFYFLKFNLYYYYFQFMVIIIIIILLIINLLNLIRKALIIVRDLTIIIIILGEECFRQKMHRWWLRLYQLNWYLMEKLWNFYFYFQFFCILKSDPWQIEGLLRYIKLKVAL